MFPPIRRVEKPAVALALSTLLIAAPLYAQTVTPQAIKAAFLLNFVRFSEWPAGSAPEGSPLVLCVGGDPALQEALGQTIKGQTVSGHGLEVRRVSSAEDARSCSMLYVDASNRELAERLQNLPVLTVSDSPRFSRSGGIVELTVDGGHMGFSVNVDAANRSGMKFSSQLLRLAHIVSAHDSR